MDTVRAKVARSCPRSATLSKAAPASITFEEDDLNGKKRDAGWNALGAAARSVEPELDTKLAEFGRILEAERERLLDERAIGDDREAKKLERSRGLLQKELDQVLATLRTTRELAARAATPAGSPFCGPLRVDLRILPASGRVKYDEQAEKGHAPVLRPNRGAGPSPWSGAPRPTSSLRVPVLEQERRVCSGGSPTLASMPPGRGEPCGCEPRSRRRAPTREIGGQGVAQAR